MIESCNNNDITNNTLISNKEDGIVLWDSSLNKLNGNNISGNSNYGILLRDAGSNIVFNNMFNNAFNFNSTNSTSLNSNKWNTTKTAGINIVGSPYFGGNFWAKPEGSGFSQTCTDVNGDGICDSPYTLDGSNIDYLPIASLIPVVNGNITGMVTNASSALPIVGAVVTAGGITSTTDAGGIYNISIAPATYTVAASATEYISNTTSVTVTSGATVTRDFTLQPKVAGKGDCNGDGKADIVDALFIAQNTVGLRAFDPAQSAAADVSGDGKADIVDALFIAQATVGLRIL